MIFKKTFDYEINPIEVAKWINAHEPEERIQVFANIDLGYDKKEQLKKISAKTTNELINSELHKSELLTLRSTFQKYITRIEKKLKDGKNNK